MYYSYNGLDIIILIITMLITIGAQAFINSWYGKTKEIKSKKGLTGASIARKILDENGLNNVKVVETSGVLSDHYDPKNKTVRLSPDIYSGKSLAAVSVSSHECGHAIQDKNNYLFLRIRSSIVPIVNIASSLGYVAILLGIIMSSLGFIKIGIIMECIILLFQVITLPVEFNASSRALKEIERLNLVEKDEHIYCRKMLTAAALTYVASVLTSVLEIIRLLLMARRDD